MVAQFCRKLVFTAYHSIGPEARNNEILQHHKRITHVFATLTQLSMSGQRTTALEAAPSRDNPMLWVRPLRVTRVSMPPLRQLSTHQEDIYKLLRLQPIPTSNSSKAMETPGTHRCSHSSKAMDTDLHRGSHSKAMDTDTTRSRHRTSSGPLATSRVLG